MGPGLTRVESSCSRCEPAYNTPPPPPQSRLDLFVVLSLVSDLEDEKSERDKKPCSPFLY